MKNTLEKRFDDQFLKACDVIETALISACSQKFPSVTEVNTEYFEGIDVEAFSQELSMLPNLAKQGSIIPTTFPEFLDMLRNCPHTCLPFFPTIIKVTKLLLTFPASVASAE